MRVPPHMAYPAAPGPDLSSTMQSYKRRQTLKQQVVSHDKSNLISTQQLQQKKKLKPISP